MSFLRAVRASIVPTAPAPRQIGVDDWAWSKGKTYGTLIVDLQTHLPWTFSQIGQLIPL